MITQCYYIGGTEDAATSVLNAVLKPLSYHKPAEKICEDLKKQDSQICALQYGKFKCEEVHLFFHFLSILCTYNLIEILPLGKCKEHCLTMTCTSVKKVLFGREMINLLQGSEVFASIILVEVLHMSVASFSQVNRDIITVKLFAC